MSRQASRYQPMLIALHWLTALLITGLLCLGFGVLANLPNSDPQKLQILVWHMAIGMFVLPLMILRLIIRLMSIRPPPATIGLPLLNLLASIAHYSLYVIVFAMIASGFYTGYLISHVFLPNGGPLPDAFTVFPSFKIHALLAVALTSLILVHIVAALYHQLILKDGLFSRMWFGKRVITPAQTERK